MSKHKVKRISYKKFTEQYATEEICRDTLARHRWKNGFVCPKCGNTRHYKLKNGLYQCIDCHHQTSVTAGTFMHRSHVPLTSWFQAKRFGKNTKVYVSEAVDIARGEWLQNGSPETYQSQIVDKVQVFKQLGYFNALGNGTWYDKYSDEAMLERYIASHFQPIEQTMASSNDD